MSIGIDATWCIISRVRFIICKLVPNASSSLLMGRIALKIAGSDLLRCCQFPVQSITSPCTTRHCSW